MKAEINLENKQRFFLLYPDAPFENCFIASGGGSFQQRIFEDSVKVLKPLSSISDEDAIEVAKISWNDNNWNVLAGKEAAHSIECQSGFDFIPSQSIDFLRSKGYALPWMGLSVEEMVESGWIKLIES